MMTSIRKKYDKDYKQKAEELSYSGGNAKEIAIELGIPPDLVKFGFLI